jgi:hypothetical protein
VVEGDTRGPSGGETPIFMAARAGHNQVTSPARAFIDTMC